MKNKKLLGVLGVAALLLAGNFAMQEREVVDAAASATVTELNALVTKYYNNGVYTKNTTINVTEKARQEILENGGFHNKADDLVRTTYFDGNELWMTNDAGVNSGYGTNEKGEMTHFSKVNGENVVDYTVSVEGGMEGYYITLKDVVATDEQTWSVENGIYTTSNEDVISWFKAICAPCYVGFDGATGKYITLTKVEVEETDKALELRLYASEGDTTKLSNSDLLFAQADIYSSLFDLVVNNVVYPLNNNVDAELSADQSGEFFVTGVEVLEGQSVKARKMGVDIENIGADGSGQNVAGYNTSMSIINDATSSFYLKTWADGGHSLAVTGYVAPAVKETVTIYYYNSKDWSTVNCYAFGVTGLEPNGPWPGDKMTSVPGKTDWYSIDYSAGSLAGLTIIFNNGSTQTANLPVDITKVYYEGTSGTAYSSFEEAEDAANTAVAKPDCFIRGGMNNWSDTEAWQFSYHTDSEYVFTGTFTSSQEFKVYYNGNWYGIGAVESGCKSLVSGSDNIKMKSNGSYTIYWKINEKTMWISKN